MATHTDDKPPAPATATSAGAPPAREERPVPVPELSAKNTVDGDPHPTQQKVSTRDARISELESGMAILRERLAVERAAQALEMHAQRVLNGAEAGKHSENRDEYVSARDRNVDITSLPPPEENVAATTATSAAQGQVQPQLQDREEQSEQQLGSHGNSASGGKPKQPRTRAQIAEGKSARAERKAARKLAEIQQLRLTDPEEAERKETALRWRENLRKSGKTQQLSGASGSGHAPGSAGFSSGMSPGSGTGQAPGSGHQTGQAWGSTLGSSQWSEFHPRASSHGSYAYRGWHADGHPDARGPVPGGSGYPVGDWRGSREESLWDPRPEYRTRSAGGDRHPEPPGYSESQHASRYSPSDSAYPSSGAHGGAVRRPGYGPPGLDLDHQRDYDYPPAPSHGQHDPADAQSKDADHRYRDQYSR